MKIVSWNVNSINARLEHVKRYLRETQPDVLMIQELKGLEFPAAEFQALGYETAAVPQKAYNGVAVFSKTPLKVILEKLPGDEADEQARYIEFETNGLRLINIYAPNGNPVDTDKFPYKLSWLHRLYLRLKELRENNIPFVIGGDFNIIPEDKDCHDPKAWVNDALFQPESKAAYRALINLGLTDAYRLYDSSAEKYTFWDYQAGAWPKNNGIRIDHFLLSPELTDRIKSCRIDKNPRGWDKPSDHTPIIIEIA
jgi:exodeoxyribonuclease-3